MKKKIIDVIIFFFLFLQITSLWALLIITTLVPAECGRPEKAPEFDFRQTGCRAHTANIKDFGGVGDGVTSNTKAFKSAIDQLSKFSNDRGALLYVPAGKWLTGPFNVTSHFTLFLDHDAELLATTVCIPSLTIVVIMHVTILALSCFSKLFSLANFNDNLNEKSQFKL